MIIDMYQGRTGGVVMKPLDGDTYGFMLMLENAGLDKNVYIGNLAQYEDSLLFYNSNKIVEKS